MENSKTTRAVSCSEYPHTECCTPQYWQAIRIASDWSMTCPSRRAARWLSGRRGLRRSSAWGVVWFLPAGLAARRACEQRDAAATGGGGGG